MERGEKVIWRMDGCIQLLDVLNNGMCCVIFGWPEKECLSVRACVHAGQLGPVSKPVIRVFEPLCRPSQTPPKKVTSSYVHVGAESVPAYFYFCFLLLLDLFTVVCVCVSLSTPCLPLYGVENRVEDVLLRKSTLNIFIYQNAHMLLDRLSSPPSKMNKRKNTKKIQKNKIG
jgi:hypothetical protein